MVNPLIGGRGLTAGLVLHAAAVALQYVQVHWQDDYDLETYGDPVLAASKPVVEAMLVAHGSVAGAVCCTLLSVVWWRVALTPVCGVLFLIVQLAHVAVSVACYAYIPGDGWLVLFPLQFLLLGGWMGIHRFCTALCACTVATIAHIFAVPSLWPYPTAIAMVTRTLISVFYWIGAVWISHTANLDERRRWRRAQLEKEELGRLRTKLSDLLPPAVARNIVRAYGSSACKGVDAQLQLPCEQCHAAVLELDVAGFTAMSQVGSTHIYLSFIYFFPSPAAKSQGSLHLIFTALLCGNCFDSTA